jgi:sugar phosphate isomerase/epimerase
LQRAQGTGKENDMKVRGLGIGFNGDRDSFRKLPKDLKEFQDIGYEFVELCPDHFDLIYNGRLNTYRLNEIKHIINDFRFQYTVHAPDALNLRDARFMTIHRDLLKASLDFAAEIGADVYVIHYERQSQNSDIERMFTETMMLGFDYAAPMNVQMCVENIEVEVVSKVVDFVKSVERANVGITFDFGHAYLAANYFNFDYFEAVKSAVPYLRHVHVTDNFGRFEPMRIENWWTYRTLSHTQQLAMGKGDLHLPIGWGSVPYDTIVPLLTDFSGVFLLEHDYDRYKNYAREVYETARGFMQGE